MTTHKGGTAAMVSASESDVAQQFDRGRMMTQSDGRRLVSPAAIRDELHRIIRCDLLGPAGGPEEEIHERSVRQRYLVGVLAPKQRQKDMKEAPEEDGTPVLPTSSEEGPA